MAREWVRRGRARARRAVVVVGKCILSEEYIGCLGRMVVRR